METSASTGRAEGIADGDIVSLMKKSGCELQECLSLRSIKVRGRAESAIYICISDHDPEVPDFV